MRLYAKASDIGNHNKQIFAPATKSVQIVERPHQAPTVALPAPSRVATGKGPVVRHNSVHVAICPPPAARYPHGPWAASAAQHQQIRAEQERRAAMARQQEEEMREQQLAQTLQYQRQQQQQQQQHVLLQQQQQQQAMALAAAAVRRQQDQLDRHQQHAPRPALAAPVVSQSPTSADTYCSARSTQGWQQAALPTLTSPRPLPPPPRPSTSGSPITTLPAAASPPSSSPPEIPAAELQFPAQPFAVGAFGAVYRVVHSATGQVFAAKQRNVTHGELDNEERAEFLKEVEILRSLHHPNVLKFVGTSTNPATGEIVLLTEYMEGGALSKWLFRTVNFSFTLQQRQVLALDIACGLAYIHSQSVLHCDVKTDNVLLDQDLTHAKLGDLGLAKVRSNTSYYARDPEVGTICYMAPEILNRERYSAAADVYSFALALYEMFTARRPYSGRVCKDLALMREEVVTRGVRPPFDDGVPHDSGSRTRVLELRASHSPEDEPSC